MRVLSLKLENVGPFDAAEMEFVSDPETEKAPIALLTGINGTGKTIVLDAIRGLFGQEYCVLERAIWRKDKPFRAGMTVQWEWPQQRLTGEPGRKVDEGYLLRVDSVYLEELQQLIRDNRRRPSWIVDFWRSALATDSYEVPSFQPPDYKEVLLNRPLQGVYSNASTTRFICYFDYLRDSPEEDERRVGDFFYGKVGEILSHSLLDGRFERVARTNFMPMIRQSGQVVPLANISSGNAYLSGRLMSVLWKMYAVYMYGGVPLEETCNVPGLLLIDEAENHLHPAWQKRLFSIIHHFFPNLQIIAATHSPFILASAPNARVFVCRYDEKRSSCVVEDASDGYANKPVDQILVSDAFDGTLPFSAEISELIRDRDQAADRGDEVERKRIEAILLRKNPEYFSYLDIEERMRAIGLGGLGGAR